MLNTRGLARMGLMLALLIGLAAMPPLPVGILPVPLVLQNFGVMLVALMLPPRQATVTIGLLLGLCALGLPVLTGGRGGIAQLFGPTAGFMLGWLLTPAAVALFGRFRWLPLIVAVLLPNVCGALWLALTTPVSLAGALMAVLVFVPGDAVKAGLAGAITAALGARVKLRQ